MPEVLRGRKLLAAVALSLACGTAWADVPAQRSALDAPLFYQLLLGEMELRNSQPGQAYQLYLDAARRTQDAQLFRRAMDIALQSRAGREALEATRAWAQALPDSTEPLRLELQILTALNQLDAAGEPLAALLQKTPAAERGGMIAALPRFFERATDKRRTAELLDTALAAHAADPATRSPALVARGRAWLAADDPDRALALAREGAADDPAAPGPALLAMELRTQRPEAEALVTAHLARSDAEPALRLAWARVLTAAQRYPEAIAQLETATTQQPDQAPPWLMLGALQLELRHTEQAEAALKRYVALVQPAAPAQGAASAPAADAGPDEAADTPADQGLVQAWLMLAQAAEQRGDFPAAEAWLARIDDPQRALEVQARRATLMARQGNVDAAVASLRQVPERSAADARAKLVAEAQLLRDVKRWQPAYDVFARAVERFPEDVDLLYEQAMVAEKLDRLPDMERLLRRVIEIQPEHGHAHNALGYSLADRGVRLEEARTLIRKALDLMPGDPFITDSLGWVEFRLGNLDEAERLLRQAWASRPDTEIGAHLGEVLWAQGRRDEARRIWRQAQARDDANDVLRETLARLQVGL
ncbi:tetratricopeptide repeat protein [Rubrivivax albus]|uniref:Tetratricopeptide repeat protein n=1 Tax=Rubrivivax albus TaxID=2499835 RepID=A0A437JZR8_9BURK|nr:tetratricopeptide repeat protein [Rubrivivax albus]RVT53543.1 tetratricopeptide repeat protein [Rubrivivax albus]